MARTGAARRRPGRGEQGAGVAARCPLLASAAAAAAGAAGAELPPGSGGSGGDEIITKGEPGEDFYVLESGTVDIVELGRTQSDGEGFGEIALLKNVPRTTTVRARSDVRLRAVSRPTFLAAITNDGYAQSKADAVVEEHLARSALVDQA